MTSRIVGWDQELIDRRWITDRWLMKLAGLLWRVEPGTRPRFETELDFLNERFVLPPPFVEPVRQILCNVRPEGPVHPCGNDLLNAGPGIEPKPGIGFPRPTKNPHHRPIAGTEAATESGFVHRTRHDRRSGMGMQPDPGESTRRNRQIGQFVKQVGHGMIVERDRDGCGPLADDEQIVEIERIPRGGESEAGDFGLPGMAEELPLEPGGGGENQFRLR